MKLICREQVISEKRASGILLYVLEDGSTWSLVDEPTFIALDRDVEVYKDGKNHYLQFSGSKTKYLVDAR